MIAEHPLAARLATLDVDHGWIEATLGDAAPEDGMWLSSTAIASSPAALERLFAVARASTGPADDRTVGAMMSQRVAEAGRLAGILYRRDRIVPMLPPETAYRPYTEEHHTVLRLTEPRFACLAGAAEADHPAAEPVADLDALRAVLVREVARNAEPTVEPIAHRTHLSERAVRALIAYGALVSITEAMADEGDAAGAARELRALMDAAGPFADPPAEAHLETTDTGTWFVLRIGACCRIYRWPGGRDKCVMCPIRTPAERSALQCRPHVDD